MDHLTNLPIELYPTIIKYMTIRSVFHVNSVSKHFHNIINPNINKFIYSTVDESNMLDKIKEQDKLFEKCRSNKPWIPQKTSEIFNLQINESIIFRQKIEFANSVGLILVAINDSLACTVYEFHPGNFSAIMQLHIRTKHDHIKNIHFAIQKYKGVDVMRCSCFFSIRSCTGCAYKKITCNEKNQKLKTMAIRNILNGNCNLSGDELF